MPESVEKVRADVCRAAGVSGRAGVGALRKDDLNVILDYLGGDSVAAHEVYGWDAPPKRWFYEQVAQAAGFDYDPGTGDNARPYNKSELLDLREAIEAAEQG